MTEAEWLAASDPTPMLELVGRVKPDPRRLRLFACACCRAVWDDAWPKRSRATVSAAEQFADGVITEKELNDARSLACQVAQLMALREFGQRLDGPTGVLTSRLTFAADAALADNHIACSMTVNRPAGLFRHDEGIKTVIPTVLRDIFGNPFHPVAVEPSWLTSDVVARAEGVYRERASDRLPILADALQDAGCENEDILNHCRGPGPHVRGCWVIDLLTGWR